MNFKNISTVFIAFMLFSCSTTKNTAQLNKPKNVILLISDGTGLSQISTAFYFKDSKPNYTRFKNIGLIKTSSAGQEITDSAAGATAFSAGVKTFNSAIGVANDSTVVETIVELASSRNVKTGLIASSSITHATPGSFFGHQINRGMADEIAVDLLAGKVDFFAAGGLKYFTERKDKRDLVKELTALNYDINTVALGNFAEIKASQKAGFLLASDQMPKMSEGRGDFLSDATELGIKFLSKDNAPFFIMTEGSQIDWGGHNNDAQYLIDELIDFDNLIGKVLDYAEKDGNTLVVVTSDHETGGFTLSAQKKKKADGTEYDDYSKVGTSFSTGGHSATLIPVFAYGPGSEEFNGVYENNEIFSKIVKVTGWDAVKTN
ncbi:alkaline phosphatase [Flavobacterium frigidarium]|uniref:alkaline phosphatase n=1 Tax=Flavobacterium frigidarium TaxID=99286 RepID=UPI0030DC0795|tara:strand:- start:1558 stop:2685 length:1128 start_codon:yes stop_codon:yes gene_type:complete